MSIQLNKDLYVYGMWFIECEECNWFGALIRDELDGWVFTYRFCYPQTGIENWYKTSGYAASLPEEQVVQRMVTPLKPIMEARFQSKMEFVELKCQGDNPKIMFELGSRDWVDLEVKRHEQKTPGKGVRKKDADRAAPKRSTRRKTRTRKDKEEG